MTLGRKGLTSGVIKGLTVCCFTLCARGEICIVYIQVSPHRKSSEIAECRRGIGCEWRYGYRVYP
ncbi:unnamed protein product, partial [Staurois parvus]